MFIFTSGGMNFDGSPRTTTRILGHALADLPANAHALRFTMADLHPVDVDRPKPWLVIRQDDNNNRFVLNRCETKHQADRAADLWIERIGAHHHTILIEPCPTTGSF